MVISRPQECARGICAHRGDSRHLDDRDLKLEQLKWMSQKEQHSKQHDLAMAQRNAAQVKITAAQMA